jgi:hypothetical protein
MPDTPGRTFVKDVISGTAGDAETVGYSKCSTTSYTACRKIEVPRCDGVQVALPSWQWATPLIR